MANQHTSQWNPETEEGQKNLEALERVLRSMKRNRKHREDLKTAIGKNPVLRRVSLQAIRDKLRKADANSEVAKLWSKISKKPNILQQLFPDEATHDRLAQDLRVKTKQEREEKYPQLKGLTRSQLRDLKQHLGITIPDANGKPQEWFLHLSPERTEEFRTRFLEEYRDVPLDGGIKGITERQLLALWPECPNADGARNAARHLGENRRRLEIIRDRKTVAQVDSMIDSRLAALISAGALHDDYPEHDALFTQTSEEFADDLAKSNHQLTKELFLQKIDDIVWTEGRDGVLTALIEYARWGNSPDGFQQIHTYIPLEMVKQKYEERRGITNKLRPPQQSESFVRGILRIAGEGLGGSGKFEIPPTSFRHPFEVPIDSPDWDIMNINGLNLGLPHTGAIAENPGVRALAQAEHSNHKAVFLTNVFDIEMRRASGPSRVLQALVSGITVDVEALDPDYQEDARRIIDSWVESNGGNGKDLESTELLYMTAAEIFRLLTSRGLRKITFKPAEKQPPYSGKVKPEYSGPVYVILGINEERIITAATYWEVHRINYLRQRQLHAEIAAATSALNKLENEGGDTQEIAQLQDKIGNLEARTRITNVSPQEWQRYYNMALAWFVETLEDPEVIPHCKVIGKGTTYAKIGEQIVKFSISDHTRVTDGLLAEYTNNYGPEVLRGEMAAMTVICHPYPLGHRLTAREADKGGWRGSAKVCVAPICVDTQFIRESLRQIVQKTQPIQKVAFNELSAPGVLVLSCVDGVMNTTDFPLEALAAFERYAKGGSRARRAYRPKYIWLKVATDQHWGGKSKEFVTCHACRMKLGMSDAIFHMLRHAGYNNTDNLPPIHMYSANDDPTQGHHFPAEHEPHPHELLFPDIEKELWARAEQARNTRGRDRRTELEEYMVEFALNQILVRGVYCTTDQVHLVLRDHLQANAAMFDGVLRRAHESGVTLRGVSDFAHVHSPYLLKDSRDLGLVNFGTGNHFLKTVNGTVSEGPIYAELLKMILLQEPFWQEKRELLEHYVKGPTYGKEFVGWGTIQAPGGYEWGLDFRNSPPGLGVNWGDPLLNAVRNDLRRGNSSRMHDQKVTLKVYGDKHFLSYVRTPHAIYLLGPPGTHTDLYGELGFPPNNTGVVFIGLPAEGPDAGPILVRALMYDDIRRLVQDDPHDFGWEAFLPDAL